MEIIRIKRRITSSLVRIPKLKEYIGREVEITIVEKEVHKKKVILNSAAGILGDYKNSNIQYKEKEAWMMTVQEKHGNC